MTCHLKLIFRFWKSFPQRFPRQNVFPLILIFPQLMKFYQCINSKEKIKNICNSINQLTSTFREQMRLSLSKGHYKSSNCRLCVMFCAIWYHLHNFKNVKNTYGVELISVILQAKSLKPYWKLYASMGVLHVF